MKKAQLPKDVQSQIVVSDNGQPLEHHPQHTAEHNDDSPPILEAEGGPGAEEIIIAEQQERGQEYVDASYPAYPEEHYYVDENGSLTSTNYSNVPQDPRSIDFNFLDTTNVCCGICGEIVPYDNLMSDHLPTFHPEVLGDGTIDLEEIPYETWLREKMGQDKMGADGGYGGRYSTSGYADPGRPMRSTRTLRKVSQIRVNPSEMSVEQLDAALKKKMVEKMGRKVPVSLVDKLHARCGICNAVISLNKKFEIVHLVRHFNAWHPSAHKCAGTWPGKTPAEGGGKPLATQDFAVIDTTIDAADSLQCIWCGMFMDAKALAMHFYEVHPEEIEVPKCNLCLQELVVNARLTEKFGGEDFAITLPDEHHFRCEKFEITQSSEASLERAIEKHLRSLEAGANGLEEEEDEDAEEEGPDVYSNSRMSFGRRAKPKRQFVMPKLRQAAPKESRFVQPITECHWKCKICGKDILAAVISAGTIRHFRKFHPDHMEGVQFDICKARLERCSDGSMEFLSPELFECLLCHSTYPLHRPYNIGRAIRHLKAKHPQVMPEYGGGFNVPNSRKRKHLDEPDMLDEQDGATVQDVSFEQGPEYAAEGIQMSVEEITDPIHLEELRQTSNLQFDKAYAILGPNGETIYVCMSATDELDEETVQNLVQTVDADPEQGPVFVQFSRNEELVETDLIPAQEGMHNIKMEPDLDQEPSTSGTSQIPAGHSGIGGAPVREATIESYGVVQHHA